MQYTSSSHSSQSIEINSRKKISPPNYTQVPNIIFDYWMSRINNPEFKVLLCICRATFGWHRERSYVSLKKLEILTGISRQNISKYINTLIELGLVIKFHRKNEDGGDASNEYTINVDIENLDSPVYQLDSPPQSNPQTPPSLPARPPSEETHTYTKEIDKKETSSESSEIASFFLSKILEKKPDFKKPNLKTWAKQIDEMLRIDNRTVSEAKAVITWLVSDPFWFSVVMCAQSLRKNFDKIEARMSIPKGANNLVDQIKAQFQNHAKYNGAECFIDAEGIAFQRGMTHMQVKFNDNGLKDQYDSMLRKFGIR